MSQIVNTSKKNLTSAWVMLYELNWSTLDGNEHGLTCQKIQAPMSNPQTAAKSWI